MQTANLARPAGTDGSGLTRTLRNHPLLFYFGMAFLFSWIALVPFILAEWGLLKGDWRIAFVLNPFVGPALSAFVLTGVIEGKEGVMRLLRRLVQWREGWQWYAFILIGIPAFCLAGIALMPGALASFKGLTPAILIGYPINFVVIFFLGGPLGEEIGWRGFALPRLQERYGALGGSLLLGVMWTLWHLPHFLTSAQRGGPNAGWTPFWPNLPIFFCMVMALTLLFTWVSNHTRGSLFMAVLLHASINTLSVIVPLFPAPAVQNSDLAMAIGWGALGLIVLALSRGRLGAR